MKMFRAQWLKTKSTSLRLMLISLPLLYGVLSGSYLSNSVHAPSSEEQLLYFFIILTILALFFSSVFIYLIVEIDKNSHCFIQEKCVDFRRWPTIISKYALVCLLILGVYGLSFFVFYLVQGVMGVQRLSMLPGIKLIAVSFLLLLPLLALYMWLSYRFSFSVSMVTSILVTLASIILGTTNLGEGIWQVMPPAWGLRVITFEPSFVFEKGFGEDFFIVKYGVIAVILFGVGLMLHIIWYNQWEELKEN